MNSILLVETENKANGYRQFKRPQVRKKKLGGITINYLVKFLELLQSEKRAADVYRLSPYKFKHSTLETIKWCLEKKLILKNSDYRKNGSERAKPLINPKVSYKITEDGRELLRIIR